MCRGGGYGGRGYGGGYYNSPFRTFINISDLFFYWDPYYSRRQKMMRRESTGPNFFEAIFSFGEAPSKLTEGHRAHLALQKSCHKLRMHVVFQHRSNAC